MSIEDLLTHRRAAGVLVSLTSTNDADMATLGALFDTEEGSLGSALAAASTGTRRINNAKPATAMLVFKRLGLAYGAVTQEGLQALRNHNAVANVSEANSLRLIRPIPHGKLSAASSEDLVEGPTWGIRALKVDALWALGLSGKGVLVGHLDTGIDGAHPMLEEAIEKAAVFDFLGRETGASKPPTDSDDHGTHTAGTIAGRKFKKVEAGVAPGAKLLTAEVIDGGNTIARVLGGMEWALEHGARILSLSLGWPGYTDSFLQVVDALRSNECLPVIAAGNEGVGMTRSPGNYVQALSIGAISSSLKIPDFSSSEIMKRDSGVIVPDIVAPGVDVWSSAPGGGFQSMNGTSMATPHVAGLAALLMEAYPDATIDDVEAAILQSAAQPKSMSDSRGGRGIPNGKKALALLKQEFDT